MGGISRHIVTEYNELLRFAALDDLLRSRVQFRLDLVDNWYYQWRQERENEYVQLVCVSLAFDHSYQLRI